MAWHDNMDDSHESVLELMEWITSLKPFAQQSVLGQIDALLELAAAGEIEYGNDLDLRPIRTEPDIYELKWKLLSKAVRQYHAEPAEFPSDLVKLHMHIKKFVPKRSETTLLQDVEISQAALRYQAGQKSSWGI